MTTKVVDTSVLAAWLFGESRREEAYRLMEAPDLLAPSLLSYEITSVARTKILSNPDQRTKIQQAFSLLFELESLEFVEVDPEAVLELALKTELTPYDASYLFLSQVLQIPLLTFDENLKNATN